MEDDYFFWVHGEKVLLGFDPATVRARFTPRDGPKTESKPNVRAMGYPPYNSRLIPRKGYIDAGIILTQGITITRNIFEEAKTEEWDAFAEAVDRMVNIEVDHLAPTETFKDGTVMWVYDKIPTITSMEA